MEAKELLTGMLRRTLYVVHSEPADGVSPESGAAHFDAHLRHLIEWERQGVLFGGGPILADGAVTPRAMYILRADSLDDARRIAADEPMHRAGVRTFTIDEWLLNEGRVSVTIDFSTQRAGLDGPPLSRLDQNTNPQGAQ